jgi:uncharacterized protein (DUF2062 family)
LKAVSVGFGVFMGIVPIWGLQLIVAIALSFVFKLNKALVIVAANISIPPMIPLIIYLSHRMGAIWMGCHAQPLIFSKDITFSMIQDSFLQYVVGAITLAIAAGVIFGVITYGILKFRKTFKQTSLPPGT